MESLIDGLIAPCLSVCSLCPGLSKEACPDVLEDIVCATCGIAMLLPLFHLDTRPCVFLSFLLTPLAALTESTLRSHSP